MDLLVEDVKRHDYEHHWCRARIFFQAVGTRDYSDLPAKFQVVGTRVVVSSSAIRSECQRYAQSSITWRIAMQFCYPRQNTGQQPTSPDQQLVQSLLRLNVVMVFDLGTSRPKHDIVGLDSTGAERDATEASEHEERHGRHARQRGDRMPR